MTPKDLMLAPLFLIVIYMLAFLIRNNFISPDDPTRKYFIRGLNLKIFGSFAVASIYWFYYGDGDTIWYYRYITNWRSFMDINPDIGYKLFFHKWLADDASLIPHLWRIRAHDPPYMLVVKLATFTSFFVFRSYIGIALIFSFVSYIGLWLLYRVLYHLYPHLYKQLAYSTLYVPSIIFWGSGLFKDTITMGCVAWAVYNVYRIFIAPKNRIFNILMLLLNIYLIAGIKSYIVACLLPFLLVWVVLEKRKQIKSKFIRMSLTPILMLGTVLGGVILTQRIGDINLESFEKRATDMVWWHTEVKKRYGDKGGGGSHYTIGDPMDFSPMGILKKAPLAVNVTFFRPYVWETRSPVVMFSALESLVVMMMFLYCFFKFRFGMFSKIAGDPFLIFCFGFSILFSIGVGLTSSNFGALVRYKIPAMAFFISTLVVILYDDKVSKEPDEANETIAESQPEQPALSTS